MEKNIAIEFDGVGKQYRLGLVGTGSLQHDLNRWWQTAILRKEDPYLKIGEVNDRSKKGTSDYVWALKDISFKVEQGDVVGIIGKNGAGKSTLLKLLSHITAPSVGHISYRGRIASLLEVGTGFHPEMTARQNIYMNGSIMGMTRHEISSKLDEIVDFAGIERYLDTPVKRFSSGMTVRLGFAVAAFLEPEILVVDEVLAVGDAEFQKKAIGKMKDVSSQGGRTVLFVSHNMAAVKNLCKNGILLKNGQLNFTGNIDQTIEHYMTDCEDLSDVTSFDNLKRSGNGKVLVENIEYVNANGDLIIPQCGAKTKVRITVNAKENVKGLKASFGIRDIYGNPMLSLASEMVLGEFSLTKGIHHLYVNIDKLPLTEGVYKLAFWIGTVTGAETYDYIDNVIQCNVSDGDFFNRGQQISKHLFGKIVLYDHEWVIE